MTVRVERVLDVPVGRDEVWEFIADPAKRAAPISVVSSFEQTDERTARWHIKLPIPFVDRTITVDTEDVETDPPRYVRFVGRSKAMRVQGEHELESIDDGEGTRLTTRFVVDGKVPGVERFFKKNLDKEMDNIEASLREEVGTHAGTR